VLCAIKNKYIQNIYNSNRDMLVLTLLYLHTWAIKIGKKIIKTNLLNAAGKNVNLTPRSKIRKNIG